MAANKESISITYREGEDDVPTDHIEETATGGVQVDPEGSDALNDDGGSDGERPEWLDEKFDSPEDMAKAYRELQARFSRGERSDETETDDGDEEATESEEDTSLRMSDPPSKKTTKKAEAEKASGVDFNALSEEYMENGELSEDTLGSLEEAGIGREFVNRYIRGLQAEAAQVRSRVAKLVGGEENLSSMMDWARANLSDAEKEYFDRAWQSGDEAATNLAVRGVYAQFVTENGKDPKLLDGKARRGRTGPKPFGSLEDYVDAISGANKVKYDRSAEYRAEVDRRLAASTF